MTANSGIVDCPEFLDYLRNRAAEVREQWKGALDRVRLSREGGWRWRR